MRLLEQVTGRTLSADSVARHLGHVGFPVKEIIELLPYDPEIRTARITGKLKDAGDGVLLTAETKDERYYVYSATEVVPESVVGITVAKSPLAKDVPFDHKNAAAVVVTEQGLGLEDDRPVVLPKDTPLARCSRMLLMLRYLTWRSPLTVVIYTLFTVWQGSCRCCGESDLTHLSLWLLISPVRTILSSSL